MIELSARTEEPVTVVHEGPLSLTLVFQDRQRSRLRVSLSNGQTAVLLLPRGSVLRGGDRLLASDGRVVQVQAAPEAVSTVRAADATSLARAAYHLGNRHVPLQVGDGFLRYLHDHVLDAMVREHGLVVLAEEAPFEPESGAYGKHTHGAGHHHGHDADEAGERLLAHGVRRALGLVDVTLGESVESADAAPRRTRGEHVG